MTDKIREAAELAVNRLFINGVYEQAAVNAVEAALREKFAYVELASVLPDNHSQTNGQPSQINPAYYRPAVAALIKTEIRKAQRAAFKRAADIASEYVGSERYCEGQSGPWAAREIHEEICALVKESQ